MHQSYLNKWEQLILYGLVYFLLVEWLKPVMELTGTGHFKLFAVFIIMCLLFSLMNWPHLIKWVIKLGYIAWVIENVYNSKAMAVSQFFKAEFVSNGLAIRGLQWEMLTNGFRTLLFFGLIWMLVYLINHWITVRISIFYFFVMTVLFIATLDTFSSYDGSKGIVKVVVIGLIMTSLLFLKRYVLRSHIMISWQRVLKYMVPVAIFVGLAGVAAYYLPKAEALWPDPVPFIKSVSEGAGVGSGGNNGTMKKIGYGENDENLGGSFVADNTLVYQVISLNKQYWRVEMKDTYTSKGWVVSNDEEEEKRFPNGELVESSLEAGTLEESTTSTVTNYSEHNFILQPYGLMSYDAKGADTLSVVMTEPTEKMYFVDGDLTQNLTNYDIVHSEPKYSYKVLKASQLPSEFAENYLALPDTVPERVGQLAQEITEKSTSAWDKARAIEKYFGRSGFTYSTDDVPIPSKNQDYVDQFLFETRLGYCDNFSTSMVVMLRSIGIPARWVKGFVTGDIIETYDDGRSLYQITNNEAHSWVEAYIDGVGWVPFEPTIGYSSPIDIDFGSGDDTNDQLLEKDKEKDNTQEQTKNIEEKDKPAVKGEKKISFAWLKISLIIIGSLLIIAAIVLFYTRKKWLPKYYIQKNRKVTLTTQNYRHSYETLLKQLASYGLNRSKDQTLSNYAKLVDAHFETDAMSQLTEVYERLIYGKNVDESQFNEMKEIWEYLINRASG